MGHTSPHVVSWFECPQKSGAESEEGDQFMVDAVCSTEEIDLGTIVMMRPRSEVGCQDGGD